MKKEVQLSCECLTQEEELFVLEKCAHNGITKKKAEERTSKLKEYLEKTKKKIKYRI